MVSLSGIPPLGGFVAKFNILSAAVNNKFYTLAFIGGLNSVVSLYYYIKIVRYMVFNDEESTDSISGFNPLNKTVLVALSLPIFILGIKWSGFLAITEKAVISIF